MKKRKYEEYFIIIKRINATDLFNTNQLEIQKNVYRCMHKLQSYTGVNIHFISIKINFIKRDKIQENNI